MQEPTRIIAIRHGETEWNVDTRIQGHLDIPLSATGRWQAERLAQALSEDPIDVIYASDLTRAWETAQYVAKTHGITVTAEEGLRERYQDRFQAHRMAIQEIAHRLGWSFLIHHTDRPASEPLLALLMHLEGKAGSSRYKGGAQSELSVAVLVSPANAPTPAEMAPSMVIRSRPQFRPPAKREGQEQQQQQ